jgi:carbonic anhydrase
MTSHGKDYTLLQIHFHTPSEHVTNGKPAPMEAHFVHKAADGALAVLGVFYVEGAENTALKAVFDNLPGDPMEAAIKGVHINPADILPANSGFYRYMGSLTTPPCSEGVNWFVLKKPTTASKEQIAAMAKAIGHNARPVQPLNNRLLMEPWN